MFQFFDNTARAPSAPRLSKNTPSTVSFCKTASVAPVSSFSSYFLTDTNRTSPLSPAVQLRARSLAHEDQETTKNDTKREKIGGRDREKDKESELFGAETFLPLVVSRGRYSSGMTPAQETRTSAPSPSSDATGRTRRRMKFIASRFLPYFPLCGGFNDPHSLTHPHPILSPV